MDEGQNPRVLEAEELRLVGKDGRVRARLFMDDDEPKIVLLSRAGKKRVGLGMLPTGEAGLSFYDEDERLHIALIVTAGGTPEVTVIDKSGREAELTETRPPKKEGEADEFDIMPHIKKKGMNWIFKK